MPPAQAPAEKSIMVDARETFEPGTLGDLVAARGQRALACGALQPIETEYEIVEQGGCTFVVRVATNLARKTRVGKEQAKTQANPFLPYDERMFVANLSATHACLLNKYNVIDRHILMVTRAYEDQMAPLTRQDFAALWLSLQELDGLAFYNGGPVAGASQPHKHLQLLPFPLAPQGPPVPLEDQLLGNAPPKLPFAVAAEALAIDSARSLPEAAAILQASYQKLRQALQLAPDNAFNLLATRRWLVVIPRSQPSYRQISVNSLGFAGTLFVRDRQTFDRLKDLGPLTVLAQVGRPVSVSFGAPE